MNPPSEDSWEAPVLLPARMINEFVYCPRLYYMEWVDSRWNDNTDTARGDVAHSSVDSRGGQMPSPDSEEPPLITTSVHLSDQELGVTAIIDRVDHHDGCCSSVDYKVGHPQQDGQPWPADRAQALVQAALLHKAGYRVSSAELYYRATHERVTIPWTADLIEEVTALVGRARSAAAALQPPPPLVNSARCPRCSLVGLCLPDEVNCLLDRSTAPPRRLTPKNPDQAPLYVTEQGAVVGVRSGSLRVTKNKETLGEFRLIDVSALCVFGHVQVTTDALSRLWNHGATVLWFSFGGWLNGWAQGRPSKYSELRRRQVAANSQGGALARPMIEGKIRNQRTLLRRNAKTETVGTLDSLGRLADQARSAETLGELLGVEGAAARLYFQNFTKMLASPNHFGALFDALGRNRRPPLDPINAMLSFCYSLLVRDVVSACLAVGLDPYIGILHRNRYGRPSLALDIAEEFRPLVADSTVISVINSHRINLTDFKTTTIGCSLTNPGRKKIIAAYEHRMSTELHHPVFKYSLSYRRTIDIQARMLAAVMIGELDTYRPVVTR